MTNQDVAHRQCVAEVLHLYAAADRQLRVPVDGTIKFHATFPLAMYALNQAYAALMLAEREREYLATANVRIAYEHAVTAQWVLHTPGAEEKLVGTANRHNRLVLEGMAAYTKIGDELLSGFGKHDDPRLPPFKDRCTALRPNSSALFELYQHLSVAVHPSFATMRQHLTFDPDHNIVGVAFGAIRTPPVDTWMACALSAMSAAATIEVQREDQPRMPRLLKLAETYRVPLDLRA